MPDALLIHADSLLDANMFVATGITVGDPFTYLEAGDRRIIVTNQLEVDLVRRESTANEIWMVDEFGGRDLVLDGWPLDEARMETVRRMLERAGLDAVAVPPNFPLALGGLPARQGHHADARPGAVRRRAGGTRTPASCRGYALHSEPPRPPSTRRAA